MPHPLTHRRVWIFDLDNTLYPPDTGILERVNVRIRAHIMRVLGLDSAAADALRHAYWQRHGTTLAGLTRHHGIDPQAYLHDVHDVSLHDLRPDPSLCAAIDALPGRRIVHTNGSARHAARVLAARGLSGAFDSVHGIEDAGFHPKPRPEAFAAILARAAIDPDTAAMFEDDARNLDVPHKLGMSTVHVAPAPEARAHVHHHTDDLAAFLARLHAQAV